MITRITSIGELKAIFIETLLNKTDKVSKVSDESVLGGTSFGVAKVAQKALKDIARVESHIFPDGAYGADLDLVAEKYGISPRYGASQSTTYLRVVGDPGTTYSAGIHIFSSNGQLFDLEETLSLSDHGFGYVKVRSQSTGSKTNVDPLTINSISPIPTGHKYVRNEYRATGGRDIEDDHLFRLRIKEGANLAARQTLAYLTQVLNKINNNVLRVQYQGLNELGRPTIAIATQNGITLNSSELSEFQSRAHEFVNMTELNPYNDFDTLIEFVNITYQPIDFAFRLLLEDPSQSENTRKDLQIAFSKAIDIRQWKKGQKIEWDNHLQIVKDHPNVKYVPDNFFYPNQDVIVDLDKLPLVRGFVMMDMSGNIISSSPNTLNPIYYPANTDWPYQSTILAGL